MFLFQDTKRFKRSPESEESDESEESVESEENLDRDCTNKIKTHSYLKFQKLTWWEPGGAWWENMFHKRSCTKKNFDFETLK